MLRQINPVLRNVVNFSKVSVRASSAAAHGHEHHPSDLEVAQKFHNTLNDIPVPQGSWQEHYDKRNAKWSKLLGASIVVFAGSMYAFFQMVDFNAFTLSDMKKLKLDVE